MRSVVKGKFDFDGEEWEDVSKEAKDLIKKLITQPEKRLTAEEALEHKWFKMFKNNQEPQYLRKKNLKAFKQYVKHNKLQ